MSLFFELNPLRIPHLKRIATIKLKLSLHRPCVIGEVSSGNRFGTT